MGIEKHDPLKEGFFVTKFEELLHGPRKIRCADADGDLMLRHRNDGGGGSEIRYRAFRLRSDAFHPPAMRSDDRRGNRDVQDARVVKKIMIRCPTLSGYIHGGVCILGRMFRSYSVVQGIDSFCRLMYS